MYAHTQTHSHARLCTHSCVLEVSSAHRHRSRQQHHRDEPQSRFPVCCVSVGRKLARRTGFAPKTYSRDVLLVAVVVVVVFFKHRILRSGINVIFGLRRKVCFRQHHVYVSSVGPDWQICVWITWIRAQWHTTVCVCEIAWRFLNAPHKHTNIARKNYVWFNN